MRNRLWPYRGIRPKIATKPKPDKGVTEESNLQPLRDYAAKLCRMLFERLRSPDLPKSESRRDRKDKI